MALLKIKLDGETYTVDPDKLTLGEACTLEEDFGVEDLAELNFFKATHLSGLFFIAVKRKHPDMAADDILAKVREGVSGDVFKDINKQVEEAIKKAADPPRAGASASAPATSGGPAKTPGKPGGRSSPKS